MGHGDIVKKKQIFAAWGTCLANLGTLGLWVLELFAMYATDGHTDGRTDKCNAYCPLPYGSGGITSFRRSCSE